MQGHFTVDEAAESLGVSTRTIYTYLKEGKLTGKKQGNRVHIPAKEVEKLKSPAVSYNPETQVVIDRAEYEALIRAKGAQQEYENLRQQHDGLLVKLGQLEAETRFMKQENQKLLADMNFRDEKSKPWWKRIFAG